MITICTNFSKYAFGNLAWRKYSKKLVYDYVLSRNIFINCLKMSLVRKKLMGKVRTLKEVEAL